MVFGFKLFGSSSSSPAGSTSSAATSTPEECTSIGIPEEILSKYPSLKLQPYNPGVRGVASNAIVVPHNACRMEIADMYGDILPSIARFDDRDMGELSRWWNGFARFALTTSMVDDLVVTACLGDIIEDFDKDATMISKNVRKFREKNSVTLEMAARGMSKALEVRDTEPEDIVAVWDTLVRVLTDIYTLVEKILRDIDLWRRDEIAVHKDLEKKITGVYTDKKRWGSADAKRGELIVILTRSFGNEPQMRTWMKDNLSKKELNAADRWMDNYRENRLAIVDNFHKRYLAVA